MLHTLYITISEPFGFFLYVGNFLLGIYIYSPPVYEGWSGGRKARAVLVRGVQRRQLAEPLEHRISGDNSKAQVKTVSKEVSLENVEFGYMGKCIVKRSAPVVHCEHGF